MCVGAPAGNHEPALPGDHLDPVALGVAAGTVFTEFRTVLRPSTVVSTGRLSSAVCGGSLRIVGDDALRAAHQPSGDHASAAVRDLHDLPWRVGALETGRTAADIFLFGDFGWRCTGWSFCGTGSAAHLPLLYGIPDCIGSEPAAAALVHGEKREFVVLQDGIRAIGWYCRLGVCRRVCCREVDSTAVAVVERSPLLSVSPTGSAPGAGGSLHSADRGSARGKEFSRRTSAGRHSRGAGAAGALPDGAAGPGTVSWQTELL